jgi:hypothetical protein
MLAFDSDEMFKTEFFLSETNSSSTSFDLGASPNPAEAVMDQWPDLLTGSSDLSGGWDHLIDAHLQTAGSGDEVDQREGGNGELADLLTTSDDPHRTDSRDDEGHGLNEFAVTGKVTEECFPVFTADRSNRREHDYNLMSAADGDEDVHDDDDDDDDNEQDGHDVNSDSDNDQDMDQEYVPQTRAGRRSQRPAAVKSLAGRQSKSGTSATPTTGNKRAGLRQQPTRKRCYSTSSITSQDLDRLSPGTSGRPSAAKRRKPSGDSAVFKSGGDKCMSRNAIAARENREKKKALMRQLEDQVDQQQEQIDRLVAEKEIRDKAMAALAEEVSYLRGVLKNESEIATVINSIRKAPGITDFRTSFGLHLRSIPRGRKIQDENATPVTTTAAAAASSGKCRLKNPAAAAAVKSLGTGKRGVCVHVNNGAVSLEFCAHCSQTAARSSK